MKPTFSLQSKLVPRYYTRLPFNPNSPDQIRAYLAYKGLKTGKAKKAKTNKQTTGAKALEKLQHKDPFFKKAIELRGLADTYGDYVKATWRLLGEDGRIHPEIIHRPSTQRDSSISPNIQQVVHGDDEATEAWDPAGFRRCIIASPGHVLVEADYDAIEGVTTGWCCGDPDYIRIAQAGIHAYLTAMAVDPSGVPSPSKLKDVSPVELKNLLKPFKQHKLYPVKKKTVHRVNYGSTSHGMQRDNPEIYPTVKVAQAELEFYSSLCPKVFPWQNELRNVAARQNYLGGGTPVQRDAWGGITKGGHPFGYKHWFYAVVKWHYERQVMVPDPSGDGNRVVAFFPQSIAAGIKNEAELRLHTSSSPHYIGGFYEGRTPFRAPIHDSGLFEVPERSLGTFLSLVVPAMTLPVLQLPCPLEWGLGEYLQVGVSVKVGRNWGAMEEIRV